MPERLSATMASCLNFIRDQGGSIDRTPGGFWGYVVGPAPACIATWFGSSTIAALVSRGSLTYSAWQRGSDGRSFPIQAKLVDVTKI